MLHRALLTIFVLFFCACVSINLPSSSAERANKVQFQDPAEPFIQNKTKSADKAWKNIKNGNSISYFSVCNENSDPALESVLNEFLSSLDTHSITKKENVTFNDREALRAEAEGLLDGVKTRLQFLIFKKNNCTYSISFVGVNKNFDEDKGRFENFLNSFRAP